METRSFIFERRFSRKLWNVLRKRGFYPLGKLLLLVKRYFGTVPSTKRTSQNLKLRGHCALFIYPYMLLSQIPWTQLNQIRRMTGPIFTQAAFSLSWFLISIERLACHGYLRKSISVKSSIFQVTSSHIKNKLFCVVILLTNSAKAKRRQKREK